jgi:hypothetical protein
LKEVGREPIVSIHEDEDFGFGCFRTKIALDADVAGGAVYDLESREFRLKRFGFGNCLVVRMAVDDDNLKVAESLRRQVRQKVGEIFFLVKGGDDDREERCFHIDSGTF